MRRRVRLVSVAFASLLFAMALAACDSDSGPATGVDVVGEVGADTTADTVEVPPHTSTAFETRAVIGQVYVWNAAPGLEIELLGPDGQVLASAPADDLGSRVFRELAPGPGYVARPATDPEDYSGPITVRSREDEPPDEAFYADQVLEPGFQYLTMRDGTTLSAFVSLPGPPENGPYPTLVNYSGYAPSRPGQRLGDEVAMFCDHFPILCDAPNYPSGLIMGLMGYAVVGVNVRGTGCSGGAYDYFDAPQLADGYDVIEIVAHQPWCKHHHVGMVGLSFPGITQLFVAAQRPPSLAAIAPMSVIADTMSSTLVPGGIYNNGFAFEWIENVLRRAEPYDPRWVQDRVLEGDAVCDENQKLHGQLVDAVTKALDNPFYSDEVAGPIDPSRFVDVIDVPVFLTGQCQDEQTGPHFATLFDDFTSAPFTRFTMTNGVHEDGFTTQIVAEWTDFLAFYVAREIPWRPEGLEGLVPLFMTQVYGAPMTLPPAKFDDFTDFDEALATFEAQPPVRVIFESGTAPGVAAGAPQGAFEIELDEWPPPGTVPHRWYFQPDGSMQTEPPSDQGGASAFSPDPEAGERVTLASGSVTALQPDWDWPSPSAGTALSWVTPALEETLPMIGSGSVDLWLQSTADDADLEVCLTEVRPDGMESYVQCGWLRASHRALRADATELRPVKSHYEADIEPLVAGEWNEVRVEIMPFVHVFRAGSRIRLTLDTPGESMARWRFLLLDYETTPTHAVAHQAAWPSSVVLPVVPEVDVPTELPECHALRGQPCHEYEPFENEPFPPVQ